MSQRRTRRVEREIATVRTMIHMYCAAHHGSGGALCGMCQPLADYTERRVRACRYGADKPTCLRCPVHCFRPAFREEIRRVMRFAGPRMAWRHPWLALRHLLDGRRAPLAPAKEGAP